jgi:hypothetical protein
MSESLADDVDIVEIVRIDKRAIMHDEFCDVVLSAIRSGVRKPFAGKRVLGVMHGTDQTSTSRDFVIALLLADEEWETEDYE